MTTVLPDLLLYTRPGCHLCDDARAMLEALLAERAAEGLAVPRLREIDIAADPALERTYHATIPVVELAGRQVDLATSPGRLRRLLGDVLDGTAEAGASSLPR